MYSHQASPMAYNSHSSTFFSFTTFYNTPHSDYEHRNSDLRWRQGRYRSEASGERVVLNGRTDGRRVECKVTHGAKYFFFLHCPCLVQYFLLFLFNASCFICPPDRFFFVYFYFVFFFSRFKYLRNGKEETKFERKVFFSALQPCTLWCVGNKCGTRSGTFSCVHFSLLLLYSAGRWD